MKKTKALLSRLIEELEKTGLVLAACEKAGVSRNTFYRWMKEDEEFLSRVNEAMSLGTGLVSDVAISNVLDGIKKKDPMYTKYWLSHRHPDFRRPYVFKVDSDDLISHFRSTREGVKKRQIEEEIRETMFESQRQRVEKAEESVRAFMDKWKTVNANAQEKRARELFEEWKKEYEAKKNKRKPSQKD